MRIPFAIQSYRDRSLPLAAQRLINWMPEVMPVDAKARVVLRPTPGLQAWVTLPTSPVRAMAEMAGVLFVLAGNSVYRVTAAAVATKLGEINTSSGLATMAGNGTQMVVCDGVANEAWIATPTGSTLDKVTDTDFEGGETVAVIDGYAVFNKPDTTEFFLSAINDASAYNALDFAAAEGSPDNIVRVFRVGRELWLFGEKSIEVWSNIGAADFPFLRVSGAFVDRGCGAPLSPASRLGVAFWLGDDRVVYRGEGFNPVRISTHAVEQALASYSTVQDACGWCYDQEGHSYYVLTFPTGGQTWVYDITTGTWHERASEGRSIWRAYVGVNYATQTIAGDAVTGDLYIVNPTFYLEGTTQIVRVATGTAFHAEARKVFFSRFSAEFETGVGLTSGQGDNPQAFVSWSNDGGRTFGSEIWAPLGRQGAYATRLDLRRLGSARDRVFRIAMADPVGTTLAAVNVEAESGQD